MNSKRTRVASAAAILGLILLAGSPASAENNRVQFPANLDQLVHYTTVTRGNVTENILTTRAAIDAVKSGRPIPGGTHFVLADYRDGAVFRYFVMQKGDGWGAEYEASRRTGDWQFQAFKPDRTVNLSETTARCRSCHQSRPDNEFLYTFDQIRAAK
jgi:Cytochrome P460